MGYHGVAEYPAIRAVNVTLSEAFLEVVAMGCEDYYDGSTSKNMSTEMLLLCQELTTVEK